MASLYQQYLQKKAASKTAIATNKLSVVQASPQQSVKVVPSGSNQTVTVAKPQADFVGPVMPRGPAVAPKPFIGPVMPAPKLTVQPLGPQPRLNTGGQSLFQTPNYTPQTSSGTPQQLQPTITHVQLPELRKQNLNVTGVDGSPAPAYVKPQSFGQKLGTFIDKTLPNAAAGLRSFGKEVAQGTARNLATPLMSLTGQERLNPENYGKFAKAVFGNEPVKSFVPRAEENIAAQEPYVGKLLSKLTGPTTLVGSIALDAFFGGGTATKNAIKALAVTKDAKVVAGILKSVNVADDLIADFAPIIAKTSKEAEVSKIIEHIAKVQKTTKNVVPGARSALTARVPDQTGKLPQLTKPKIEVPYGAKVAQNTPVSQERKMLTTLKENPLTAKVFANEANNYERLANEVPINKVKKLIETDYDEAYKLATSGARTVDAAATRNELILQAVKRGDADTARKLAQFGAPEATEMGRAVQIHRMLSGELDTPADAIFHAAKDFEDTANKINPRFRNYVNKIGEGIDDINKKVADEVAKQFEALPKATLPKDPLPDVKVPTLPKTPVAKKPLSLPDLVNKAAVDPADDLARRISPYTKAKKPNPVKDMIAELYKLAQEQLPAKGKKPPKSAIDSIGQALRDKDTYKDVWLQAQKIVRDKWADRPDALTLLDKYFNKTLLSGVTTHAALPVSGKTIGTAVKQGMKQGNVNLGEIVRKHFTVLDNTGKDLVTKLVEEAGVPAKEAQALAIELQKRFSELATARKQSLLQNIFRDKKITKDTSFVDRIIELSNLGAFDKLEFADKLAQKLGLPVLTTEVTKKVMAQAEVIQGMEKGWAKQKEIQKLLNIIDDAKPLDKWELAGEIANIPRTIQSSLWDLSGGFRQGLWFAPSYTKEFAIAYKDSIKAFAKEGAYDDLMDAVIKNEYFEDAQKHGIAFTQMTGPLKGRDERYMAADILSKIPILGKGIRMTARSYDGLMNKMRMDTFARMIDDFKAVGVEPDDVMLKQMAGYVNNGTGRGDKMFGLLKVENAAPLLNALFYSPRLMASRTTLLNPLYYKSLDAPLRKNAIKDALRLAGTVSTVLGLAKLSGAKVETDWRSADFGKIRIGNTRIDIAGGFQQWIRAVGQLYTGEYINSSTGKLATLGEGYKPLTRKDIIYRVLESKEAPIPSFLSRLAVGKDIRGEDISVGKEIGKLFTPMLASDLYAIYKDNPDLMPVGLLAVFGFGVQTYAPPPAYVEMDRIDKSEDPDEAFRILKKEDPKLAEQVKTAKKTANYTREDWKLKEKGVEDGERAKELFALLNPFSGDERKAKVADWKKKGIISKEVDKQLRYLFEHRDTGQQK